MPDFTRHAVNTAIELAVQDQRAADAGGDGRINHVVVSATRAQLMLRERRAVRAVFGAERISGADRGKRQACGAAPGADR